MLLSKARLTLAQFSYKVNCVTTHADLTDFIVTQLNAKGVMVTGIEAPGDLQAYCFVGHDRKTPSLHIRRSDGAFYCFGCGIHGKNWNSIKAFLDVDVLREQDLPDDTVYLKAKIEKRIRDALNEVNLPYGIDPWTNPYRKVHPDTLRAVEAGRWFDSISRCFRIMFPIKMYGKLAGWTARRLDRAPDGSRLKTPYRNAPNISSKALLYPFDFVANLLNVTDNTVVLVEGPYDALRLVNYNIPALSILGAHNFSERNVSQISSLGVSRVIVTTDANQAGEGARIDIALELRKMFAVEHFTPPPTCDPGNMPIIALEALKELVHQK